MSADALGRALIEEGTVPLDANWFDLQKALGAQSDAEVGAKLPDKGSYEEVGGALLFPSILAGGLKSPFVIPLDAWTNGAMAWGRKFSSFVQVADQADPDIKAAVSAVSRQILDRWQILSEKGWVSGYTASDEAAEDVRRFIRDNAGDALKIGGGVFLVLLVVLAVVVLK